ncbi:uncharacterized protein LOC143888352 [Tasmannia lanceolata]|uniref:uncharacterized protein LOC143888352 n=1 Tax=Tasmannia lanceolata TaxID=3420 RepID=UPI0040641350
MAVSAFKSTSRRGNLGSSPTNNPSTKENSKEDLGKKLPRQRSRSVSALSRSSEIFSSSSSNTVDFLNKRDNPLFCSTTSSPPDEHQSENAIRIPNFVESSSKFGELVTESMAGGVSDSRKGRSVSRNVDSRTQFSGPRKESGRSLSRVDTGRRNRSLSRDRYGNSESEIEHKSRLASSLSSKNGGTFSTNGQKKANLTTNASALSGQTRSLQTWSSRHPISEPSDASSCMQASSWEDGISTSSYSESEEKTIKAVSEQKKSFDDDAGSGGIYETVRSEVRRAVSEIQNDLENVIRRKNASIITTPSVADIPPELVNPDAIELVSDIRREYATKLEQSQERARKLRADLAVEEQRGQELSRIVKEILPDPMTSETQKSRPRRKTSIERRKMSKRLTEEAMNYFDECVSISTFDSSDFSSPEDPPLSSGAAAPPVGGSRFYPSGGSSASTAYSSDGHLIHNKESHNQAQSSLSYEFSDFTASDSTSKDTDQMQANDNQVNLASPSAGQNGNVPFSFALELAEMDGIHNIRNYINNFKKELRKGGVESWKVRSSYNADDYDLSLSADSLLSEKVILRNRIEYGGLLLCSVRIS